MKSLPIVLTLGLLLGTSAPALAAATPEEAHRLTTLFQSYLGQTPGVVSIMPAGDSYAAKLDLTPLFAKVKGRAVNLSLSPLELTLTDQGGGKWQVDQNQPLTFAFGVNWQSETTGSIASVTATGIFDEALGGFTTGSAQLKTIATSQTMTDGGGTTRIAYAVDSITIQTTTQGTGENADATSNYALTGLEETISVPATADGGTPAMNIVITSPSGRQDSVVKGMKLKAIGDLVTWLMAHPDPEAITAEQAMFKDKLRAALPLFTSMTGAGTLEDVTASSPLGQFSVKRLGFGAEMNGIVADGRLRESFSFSGLQVPQALLPAWATGLLPQDFSLDVSIAGFDLAAPAAMILDKLDLSRPEPLPKDIDGPLIRALLPTGSATITLGPSKLLAGLYDLRAEGRMTAGPVAMPSGEALVSLKGMDETMAALQAAPQDIQQMSAALLLAKGLGKAEPDGALSWKIDVSDTGAVTVNGADVSKMLGGGGQ